MCIFWERKKQCINLLNRFNKCDLWEIGTHLRLLVIPLLQYRKRVLKNKLNVALKNREGNVQFLESQQKAINC